VEIPQVVRNYIEMFTATSLDAWLAIFAPDGTYSSPNVPKPTQVQDLKKHFTEFFVASNQVTEQHRQMAALARGTALAWFGLSTNRRGSVERRGALRAKSGFGWILEPAILTWALKRSRALNAELRALMIFR
jgi:hypothetical protein